MSGQLQVRGKEEVEKERLVRGLWLTVAPIR